MKRSAADVIDVEDKLTGDDHLNVDLVWGNNSNVEIEDAVDNVCLEFMNKSNLVGTETEMANWRCGRSYSG
jgi:hypothetical protein